MVRKDYYKRYYKKKYLLQICDRILLFLDHYVGIYDQAELPITLTQSGIARALEIRRSQVSQVIGGLVENGFISGELRHVQGGKRRRICYFLTSRGMDRAREIETGIGGEHIELLNAPGGKRTVRLQEIPALLADGSTILDIVTHIRKSAFDMAAYKKRMVQKRKLVTSKLPKLRRFFGRRKELKVVKDFLQSKEQRILAVRGIAGIGKSTLAAKVMEESKDKTNLFYYQLKDWTTLRSLLLSLSKLLTELERNDLKFYLESNKEIDLDEIGLVLEECLRGLDGIMVLDDCQSAKGDVLDFLKSSMGFLGASNGFRMIVLGRRIPPFYDTRDVSVRNLVAEMRLGGLTDNESRRLLSSRNLPRLEVDEIIKKTEGHPLFLELVNSSMQVISGDVKRFLIEEVSSKLSKKEESILTSASVFRHPVNAGAFYADARIEPSVIESLVSQSLLSVEDGDRYAVHDTIKEFFYSRLPDSRKELYHKSAGSYYSSFSNPASVLEAQHHFMAGKAFEQVAELITLHGEDLIREGHSEDLQETLNEMKDPNTWSPFVAEIHLLKGRVLNILGRWRDAIECLKMAERASVEEGATDLQLEATSRIGEIMRKNGRRQEALDILQSTVADIREETDKSVTARVYRNLALTYASYANYDEAYSFLDLLDRATSESPSQLERADFFATKGAILSLSGLNEKAYESREKTVRICEENHDVLRLANAYNGLGTSLYHLQKNDLALEYFERAIKFAQRIGDIRTQGFILFNTASVYIEKPSLYRAQECLDSAKAIFERLEDSKMIADIDLSLAFVELEKGDSTRAAEHLTQHLTMIKKYGSPSDIIESNRSAGELYKDMGFTDEARKCFELALSFSEEFGQPRATPELTQELKEKSKPR
jgi:tetratricopeptide (TPR) repeat protein/DNA-binding MarR family transcriptional regulator